MNKTAARAVFRIVARVVALAAATIAALLAAGVLASCTSPGVPKGEYGSVETDHFVYYYTAPSGPPSQETLAELEKFYELVGRDWGFPETTKIRYFKFKDVDERKQRTGKMGNGEAFVDRFEVQSIWDFDSHETAHVYTVRYAGDEATTAKISAFWREGIAMYYSWPSAVKSEGHIALWWGKPLDYWAKQYVATERSVADVTPWIHDTAKFRAVEEKIGYPVAGSFVAHLIEADGLEKFKAFFKGLTTQDSTDAVAAFFEESFGESSAVFQDKWKEKLAAYQPPTDAN